MRFLLKILVQTQLDSYCIFKDKLTKISLIWDFSTHSILPDYSKNLSDKFIEGCNRDVKEVEINKFIKDKGLDKEDSLNICRGHDVLRLLGVMMEKNEYNNTRKIFIKMNAAYPKEEFMMTLLYQDINCWAFMRGLYVFS